MHARPSPARILGVIALATAGISVSGPLARLAGAPPLAIAVWRLLLSLLILAVPLLATGSWREWRGLSTRDLAIAGGAGALLALHFWSWIASLGLTTIAASVLLVNLHPIVIVAGSALWLDERPTRPQLMGIAIALLGAALVALAPGSETAPADGGQAVGSAAMLGNTLAVIGALTVGLYYLAGRSLRQRLSLWPYVALVYGACLVSLLIAAAFTATPLWPYAPRELGIFALIALGPMLAGHTGFNWALRYVPAYVVSVALLAEPVGAALIAALLPGIRELPTPSTLLGGTILLVGLAVSARTRGASKD
ncbi:DMT family transporter [Pseudogemmatithrix spongiicola]|uniref:DMT family transporter n=1 Tax=Pseudogemmatithrix spongiicola TaxID=3062599 RepID=A0AA49JV29_9BACT|nr:DMT family transporter [Gemmatimonadaceae bacterium 'strain 138']WKW15350.1 DMT family transporter [Gemmatimonadaceae bacterium 'strain 318']